VVRCSVARCCVAAVHYFVGCAYYSAVQCSAVQCSVAWRGVLVVSLATTLQEPNLYPRLPFQSSVAAPLSSALALP